jgi:hypothetical protein
MSENWSENSEISMSALVEAKFLIREIAWPYDGKAALLRAARVLRGWSHNRIKDVYYGDRRIRISGDELSQLRAAKHAKRVEETKCDPAIENLRKQLEMLEERMARLVDGAPL